MAAPRFLLWSRFALGDIVCMTGLVRDLALTYPGQYEVMTHTSFSEVWQNNPYVRELDYKLKPPPIRVVLDYLAGIAAAGRGEKVHFLSWFHRDFASKTGIQVPVLHPHGDLHLSQSERHPLIKGRYWIVNAGGKLDMTAKIWTPNRFQAVVDNLARLGISCVQVGATHYRHVHPPLRNVCNMIGKTDSARDLFTLIHGCDGVICGVTACMHIAACFQKPCVVIAGGREEPVWEGYCSDTFGPSCSKIDVPHQFLHTVGLLDCGIGNLTKGCWRKRTVPIEASDRTPKGQKDLCRLPVYEDGAHMPRCLEMITVDHVLEAVMSFYSDGHIPPIGKPTGRYSLPTASEPLAEPPQPLRLPQSEFKPQRDEQKQLPVELDTRPPPAEPPAPQSDILDHPIIGGKVTVCVLCYGPHYDLASRCINSIIGSVPRERMELRLAGNAVCAETREYLEAVNADHLYINAENLFKYPVMRRMFREPPLTTKYVVWFDDDSFVVEPRWLDLLARTIVDNHNAGCRLYGIKFFHDLMMFARNGNQPAEWFKQATWWQNVNFRNRHADKPVPGGSIVDFVTGGFFAIATETILVGDVPDVRLLNNGGDCCLGEQVRQAGGRIKQFNEKKSCIFSSGAPRRGITHPFPWSGK